MSDSITKIEYTVPEEESGSRLDQFLTKKQPDISRSFLQKKIKEGKVLVNDKKAKAGLKLTNGDHIILYHEPPKELSIEPENIPLDILYEDEDIIVINKPKQMVVHRHPDIIPVRLLMRFYIIARIHYPVSMVSCVRVLYIVSIRIRPVRSLCVKMIMHITLLRHS